MNSFPAIVQQYIQKVLEGQVAPYCVILDQWDCFIADIGNPIPYGIPKLVAGQSHEWLTNYLEGIARGEKLEWSFVELQNGSQCHLHILPVEDGRAIVFFDASEAHQQLVEIQQRANEMQLLNYQLAQLTEQLQSTEAALRESKQNLEQANRVKSKFIASMSHEFRTPLTSIMGHTTILRSLTADRSELTSHYQALERGAKHLLSLIENVLDQSLLEVGKIVIQPTPTPLQSICDDIDGIFKLPAQSKGLDFRLTLTADEPVIIDIDEVRCRQVLVNLIGNAVKFTDKGYIHIDISWQDHWLKLDIRDSGPGVPSGIKNHLFQPFLRGENNTKPGAGLGLALSHQLVTLMGGTIALVNDQVEGSHFCVSLPAPLITQPEEDTRPVLGPAKDINIMLVEDDPDLIKLLRFLLEQHKWRVYCAGTSAEAMALAFEKRLNLMIIDLNLPDQRGTETIRQLRSQGLTIPVLAMSASPDTHDADRAVSAGCNQYLLKPLKLPHFIATVERLLSNHNP